MTYNKGDESYLGQTTDMTQKIVDGFLVDEYIHIVYNLDAKDRRKIRQAMDYAIPREQITEGHYQGLAFPLATEIGPNSIGYDDSILAREYNITKAKNKFSNQLLLQRSVQL